MMTVGIVGLGLIGGSAAKAYKAAGDVRVLAHDTDRTVLDYAVLSGVVDGELSLESIDECGLVILATYPAPAEEYLKAAARHIAPGAVVIDFLGVKRRICQRGFALAKKYGFTFVGGHPMAGSHNAGFKFSSPTLFSGAHMVIVPPRYDDMALLDEVKRLLAPLGFGSLTVTTAEKHDEMIAFTSQLPHVISSAYIKSHAAPGQREFSGGSYRDMTRIAWLNPAMWTELFMENRDMLAEELDAFIGHLEQYRAALKNGDAAAMERLLDEGRRIKGETEEK
jgi:prephenate dehydrogenase